MSWALQQWEPSKHSMDPPPEFTGTKPSEFKSHRKKVKLWLLFTRTPAQLQGQRVLMSRLTGPAWDACDGLEPEDALPLNLVASTEHECRDLHLPAVPNTEDAARRKGDAWFWGCQNYSTCTAPTTTTPSVPQNLKTLLLTQQTQTEQFTTGSQRRDVATNWSNPGKWHGKGNFVSSVWSHHQRQGRDHWNQQVDPKEIGDRREEASSQPDGGGTHRTGHGAGRGRRSQEISGGSPLGTASKAAQNNVTEAAFRVGQTMEEMSQIRKLLEANLDPAEQRRQVRRNFCWAASKRQKPWYEAIKEEEKLLQSNKDITVQCIDFCEANVKSACSVAARSFRLARRNLPTTSFCSGGNCWIPRKPTPLPTDTSCCHVPGRFRGANILLRVLAVTERQEAQGLLDEIRQQPSVLVLSGPAIVITNVATASVFLVKGW